MPSFSFGSNIIALSKLNLPLIIVKMAAEKYSLQKPILRFLKSMMNWFVLLEYDRMAVDSIILSFSEKWITTSNTEV